jgi:hypothetical protein
MTALPASDSREVQEQGAIMLAASLKSSRVLAVALLTPRTSTWGSA